MPDITVKRVFKDMKEGLKYWGKVFKESQTDFEYALGKQWHGEDVRKLDRAGVKALTINKIKPMIKLLTGIERQSRSDYVAYPEGGEDEILSEVATRLLKNITKQSKLRNKLSDVFKEGVIGGLSYVEPYIDYTFDLINGDLKFRKINATRMIIDPNGEEYDLSDRKYVIKITKGLSKEDLQELFPGQKKKIDEIGAASLNMESFYEEDDQFQTRDYESFFKSEGDNVEITDTSYDLIEYYYKKMIDVFYVASAEFGIVAQVETKEEAESIVVQSGRNDMTIIDRRIPEIRMKQIVGRQEFVDVRAWTFPKWKSYPFFPLFAEFMTVEGLDVDLLVQGLTRSLRDLQTEYNKRRTQELRHLNSSINSGSFIPKDTLDRKNMEKMVKFGSSPGVVIEYDADKAGGTTPQSWRINPTPLSQGHAQLAAENAQDIRESSGVNPDLLANDSQSQSGRAILLKQRQGLVMVQEILDNYQQTKEILGRFILTILGDVFTIETAMRVLGDSFLKNNFKRPIFDTEGNPQMVNGKLETEYAEDEAKLIITKVLTDSSLGKYDVSVGEGAYSETVKFTNFMTLMELVDKGVPIPPDVLVDESLLSNEQKEKISKAIEQAREQIGQQTA